MNLTAIIKSLSFVTSLLPLISAFVKQVEAELSAASGSAKLAAVIAAGLAPEAAPRRPTRRTRGSDRRRPDAKSERSATKRNRQRPPSE